jgi:Trk K+ transport system NAD-binding subunit
MLPEKTFKNLKKVLTKKKNDVIIDNGSKLSRKKSEQALRAEHGSQASKKILKKSLTTKTIDVIMLPGEAKAWLSEIK